MIKDKNIDETDAKYFCAFAGKEFNALLAALKNPEKAHTKLNKDLKKLEESMIYEKDSEKYVQKNYGGEGRSLQQRLDKMVGKPSAQEQARLRALYKNDRAAFLTDPAVARRRDAYQKLAAQHDDTKGIIMSMDDDGKIIPQTVQDAKNNTTISGFLGNAGKNFMDNLRSILHGGILHSALTAAAVAGISYLAYQTAPYILQKSKYLFKKLTSGRSLAEVVFTVSDGTGYRFFYDLKINKWILRYESANFLQKKSFPDRDDVDSFLETAFCRKFVERCKEIIEPVLNDENFEKILVDSKIIADNNMREMYKYIFSQKEKIAGNMYSMKIRYEE